MLLVTDVIYDAGTTIAVAAGAALAFGVLWYLVPLRRLAADR
jgi:hypothetical protein